MDTAKRMKLIKIIGKIEKNSEFSEKIGARNKSVLKAERKNMRRVGYETYSN